MMKPIVSLAAAACLVTTGCASMFASSTVNVPVRSLTPGATVVVDGMNAGATPAMIPVDAHRTHQIVVMSPSGQGGCVLTPQVGGGWIVLDILGGGLLAIAIDAITGDWASVDDDGGCMVPV